MRALLICPDDRPALGFLAHHRPLALLPICGRSLLDLWLTDLASRGVQEILVLAADRPELIRLALGHGERWGLKLEILPVSRELTPAEARQKYGDRSVAHWISAPFDVNRVDRLPGRDVPWEDPGAWFGSLRESLELGAIQSVGVREFAPGVFVHLRARVAASARLEAPCWIGSHASIGPRARIGPGSVVEEGAFVDEGAEVAESFIGPGTYVGALTEVRQSLAWGRGLCKWTTGSCTEVADDFLLGEVSHHAAHRRRTPMLSRIAALAALGALWPVILVAWLRRRRRGLNLFVPRQAVRAPSVNPQLLQTCLYHELDGVGGLWRRWPELWNVVRGEFAFVGNRPLTRQQAGELRTDFERLWLAVPTGLVSLADVEDCEEPFGDEARAHASFYAVDKRWRSDLRILWRVFARALC